MRVKTEARRQAILDAAEAVFQEMGFEQASMGKICARVGGSKATLYSYFSSKEEILLETVQHSAAQDMEKVIHSLDDENADFEKTLFTFGYEFAKAITTKEIVANILLVYSAARTSDVGKLFFERGPETLNKALAAFIERAVDAGHLKAANARRAALHLQGLLESPLLQPCLLGVITDVSDDLLRETAQSAVEVFLAAYRADP